MRIVIEYNTKCVKEYEKEYGKKKVKKALENIIGEGLAEWDMGELLGEELERYNEEE